MYTGDCRPLDEVNRHIRFLAEEEQEHAAWMVMRKRLSMDRWSDNCSFLIRKSTYAFEGCESCEEFTEQHT